MSTVNKQWSKACTVRLTVFEICSKFELLVISVYSQDLDLQLRIQYLKKLLEYLHSFHSDTA